MYVAFFAACTVTFIVSADTKKRIMLDLDAQQLSTALHVACISASTALILSTTTCCLKFPLAIQLTNSTLQCLHAGYEWLRHQWRRAQRRRAQRGWCARIPVQIVPARLKLLHRKMTPRWTNQTKNLVEQGMLRLFGSGVATREMMSNLQFPFVSCCDIFCS